jgi:hypothetical protein
MNIHFSVERVINWVEVFVDKRIISAVKRVQSVSNRMSYVTLRGHWCNIIILNVHAPREGKIDDIKDSLNEEIERVFDTLNQMKILLDFNAKVGKVGIFKPTTGSNNLHKISNDNGVRVVNFATSKNLMIQSTMFPHCNIHKFTWMSPAGKTHNQINHILINGRRQLYLTSDLSGEQTVILTTIWWWQQLGRCWQ